MIDVELVLDLQRRMTDEWHRQPVGNRYRDLLYLVCEQHRFNYLLWHEEDIARSPTVSDRRISEVKRAIDGYNQQRNDATERIDDFIKRELLDRRVVVQPTASWNSETPGSVIDRLSILALRIFHMEEQAARVEAGSDHVARAEQKLTVLRAQHEDLSTALAELSTDLLAGRKRLKIYRQFKMYNDPALNPYLYKEKEDSRRAG